MKVAFSQQQLARRVNEMGRAISKDYAGRTLDVVIVLESSFLFAADLVRRISRPVVCHFVRSEMRDVRSQGQDLREVFFSAAPVLKGRDVLVVDAVLNTGVTQDFLLKRLEEGMPRSLKLAVLFDKTQARKVNLQPAYSGFAAASKQWVGYGLGGRDGAGRNLPYVTAGASKAARHRDGRGKLSSGRQVSRGRGKP
ncbi:MAG TPA: phosphoribosyltransferase family protein [Candidatus Aquilonibacter sp.]|nr:phosphoribosyltransferase family protein [Candidatus Aquilonibacter sp.]